MTHTLSIAAAGGGLSLHAAAPAPEASVAVSGLSLSYGAQTVLEDVDWALQPGQVVGLLGRNGAGKTSLLECLLGLREPDAGEVRLFGQSVAGLDDGLRARIGYVPQQSDLFEGFTAAQLLAYFRSFYPRWNEAKVEGLMSRWEVPSDRPITQLSGGQQQRLSIIRALAHEPDLLVLDEPVASLDPAGRRDFLRELVERVLDRGTTVVFSTHILSDLERVAFNVAFMKAGRIGCQAPLEDLLDQVRIAVGSPAELQALQAAHGAQRLREQALAAGREQWLLRFSRGVPDDVRLQRLNLEDLFMELS